MFTYTYALNIFLICCIDYGVKVKHLTFYRLLRYRFIDNGIKVPSVSEDEWE